MSQDEHRDKPGPQIFINKTPFKAPKEEMRGLELKALGGKSGDPAEEYVLEPNDIDQRCAQVRPMNSSLLHLSEDELGVSFVTPTVLTPLEERLATLLAIIESSIRD